MKITWFIAGAIFGIIGYQISGGKKSVKYSSTAESSDKPVGSLIGDLQEMFTSPPDGFDKVAAMTDIEDVLKLMKNQIDTGVVSPDRDRNFQKKEKPVPEISDGEREISQRRAKNAKIRKSITACLKNPTCLSEKKKKFHNFDRGR